MGVTYILPIYFLEFRATPHSTPAKVRSDVIDKGCIGEHDVSVRVASQVCKLLIGPKRKKTFGGLVPY